MHTYAYVVAMRKKLFLTWGLTSKEIGCSLGALFGRVDFRRGNTCYKLTAKMDWDEARWSTYWTWRPQNILIKITSIRSFFYRRQCWSWGGDLAFPLPPSQCRFPSISRSNATQVRQVAIWWIFSPHKSRRKIKSDVKIHSYCLSQFENLTNW